MINDLKQRAYEQERSENFGRAIDLYESVIDQRESEGLTHQDASVFLRIADLHLRRDHEEEAIGAFQRAGELYAREGLQPQAIAVYRRILRIAPDHNEALWNLAWLHAEMGVMAEARQYVSDYLETVDLERDWVEARDFLRRLLDLSEDQVIGLRLAELLEDGDRHEEALDVLDRLDLDFGSSTAPDEEEMSARVESLRERVGAGEPEAGPEATGAGDASEDAAAEAAGQADDPGGGLPGFEEDEPEGDFGDDFESDFGADFDSGHEDRAAADDAADEAEAEGEDDEWQAAADGEAGEAPGPDEFDLEVDPDDPGSLEEGFPFPDADEEMENGALDEEGFRADRDEAPEEEAGPDAADDSWADSWTEEPAEASGEGQPGTEESWPGDEETDETDESEPYEQYTEQDEEEQMSSQSQDLPGGPAVGAEDAPESSGPGSESDGPGRDAGGFGGPSAGSGVGRDAGAGTAGDHADYEDEYGERAELRRGLDVLDELIELDPDRLDHYRRRVGYAERLEDSGALVDSWLELAGALRRRDSSRGARLVYEHALGLEPAAERAREGIEELDRRAREELDVPDLLPDGAGDRGGADSELAERVWPELDRALGQVQWLKGAAELLRSGDGTGASGRPPADAYELAGRYYLAKDEVDDAIDTLSLAADREDFSDSELLDVLFQLGLSHYRIDDRGSARRYFDRVASHDEDFGAVCDWVLAES